MTTIETNPAGAPGACTPQHTTLNASIAQASRVLDQFYHTEEPFVTADDMGTTFASCRAVLLSSALLQSDDYDQLAEVTAFPKQFIRLTLELARHYQFWESVRAMDLRRAVLVDSMDLGSVGASLDSAMEEFWHLDFSEEIVILLEVLRNGTLFGGIGQPWICTEYGAGHGLFGMTPALSRVR